MSQIRRLALVDCSYIPNRRISVIVTATLSALTTILFVNLVPWARAAHGVHTYVSHHPGATRPSWAFMTLIPNYRGLRHKDRDALALAQRWSKYMAVTFAVGVVPMHVFEL